MKWVRYATAVVASVSLSVLVGCGSDEYKFATVSGRVTFNDEPLADAFVEFQPESPGQGVDPGPGSVGKTDKDGRYALHCQIDKSKSGAAVGKHQVRISCFDGKEGGDSLDADSPNPTKKRKSNVPVIPSRYNEKTELAFEVPANGTESADFQLKK